MKKKLASFLVLAVAVTGGIVLYEQMVFRRLAAQLQAQADTISAGYQALATENLLPLAQEHDLTPAQERIAERIEETRAELAAAGTLEQKLQGISTLQVALVSFIKTVTADQTFVKDPLFVHLQKEMGERGDMREHLTAYNTSALRWNNSLQSEVGSLTSRLDGTERNLLPYLRFDGEQEFVTIVEI